MTNADSLQRTTPDQTKGPDRKVEPMIPKTSLSADTDHTTPPDHPKQQHIDALVRAGIVTHMVTSQDALDPLFAVAHMRDLPEVQFAAAFEEGLIALGCNNGLPAELKGVATPAAPLGGPVAAPPSQTDGDQALARMEKIARQFEYLVDAMQPDQSAAQQSQDLSDRITSLEQTVARHLTPDGPAALKSIKEQVTGLHRRFDALPDMQASITEGAADQPAGPSALDRIEGQLEEILTSIAKDAGDTQILEVAQTLQTQIAKIAERPAIKVDLSAQKQEFDKFTSVLLMSIQRVEDSAKELKKGGAPFDQTTAFENLTAKIDQLLGAQETAKPVAPDLSPLTQQMEQHLELLRDWPTDLAALRAEMSQLANQPKPVLDLSEERRSFADSANTLSSAVQRLEQNIDAMVQPPEGPITELHKMVQSILETLQHIPAPQEALQRIDAKLEGIAALKQEVDLLSKRPIPMLDLSPQRAEFARFGTALADVIHRVETALDGHDIAAITTSVEQTHLKLIERIDDLPRRNDLAEAWDKNATRLVAQIDATLDKSALPANLLENIQTQIADLAQRPDPLPEMTTALGAALDRLDAATDQLHKDDPQQAQEITALIKALPEVLDSSLRQATNIGQVERSLGKIEEGLQHLPRQLGLQRLEQSVSALSNRPDPRLDLSAQRQSFARFGTALASMIERIEKITDEAVASNDQAPLVNYMTRVDAQLAQMVEDQAQTRSDLCDQLSKLQQEVDNLSRNIALENNPSNEQTASSTLDDLRMQLAELIAAQIKQNAASLKPGKLEE